MIEWEKEITEHIEEGIRLFLKYNVNGELQKIEILYDPIEKFAEIYLTINEECYLLDYDDFKVASEEQERDRQRECYFMEEDIWFDYYGDVKDAYTESKMEKLCEILRTKFGGVEVRSESGQL